MAKKSIYLPSPACWFQWSPSQAPPGGGTCNFTMIPTTNLVVHNRHFTQIDKLPMNDSWFQQNHQGRQETWVVGTLRQVAIVVLSWIDAFVSLHCSRVECDGSCPDLH